MTKEIFFSKVSFIENLLSFDSWRQLGKKGQCQIFLANWKRDMLIYFKSVMRFGYFTFFLESFFNYRPILEAQIFQLRPNGLKDANVVEPILPFLPIHLVWCLESFEKWEQVISSSCTLRCGLGWTGRRKFNGDWARSVIVKEEWFRVVQETQKDDKQT